jgi:glycosyltransferase involved in cell wall biosynthesis
MRILHVFRSPVGGLFRHVRDLARAQTALGHDVGIICDKTTGGVVADAELAALSAVCKLGMQRFAMSTMPGLGDVAATRAVASFAKSIHAEIVHGHGAKGGLYGRLAAKRLGLKAAYTPHGGSFHYNWLGPGAIFLAAERALRSTGAGLIFVCNYERQVYARKIGLGNTPNVVVPNGLWPEEFISRQISPNATELLFVGELRNLKGVDVLLRALALLPNAVTLTIVGEGRDEKAFRSLADELNLGASVKFVGRKPIAEALTLGKVLIMPSRHESLPYVVLETIATAAPIIASAVGGIPEMLPADCLVPADQPLLLSQKISAYLEGPNAVNTAAFVLQAEARDRYSVETMTKSIIAFYQSLN